MSARGLGALLQTGEPALLTAQLLLEYPPAGFACGDLAGKDLALIFRQRQRRLFEVAEVRLAPFDKRTQAFGPQAQSHPPAVHQRQVGADGGRLQLNEGLTELDDLALLDEDFGNDAAFEVLDRLHFAARGDRAGCNGYFGSARHRAPGDEQQHDRGGGINAAAHQPRHTGFLEQDRIRDIGKKGPLAPGSRGFGLCICGHWAPPPFGTVWASV